MWGKSNVLVGAEGHTKMLEGIFLKCPFLKDFSKLLGMFGALSIWHNQEYFEGTVMEAFQIPCWHAHLQASPPAARDFEHWGTGQHIAGAGSLVSTTLSLVLLPSPYPTNTFPFYFETVLFCKESR